MKTELDLTVEQLANKLGYEEAASIRDRIKEMRVKI
jgi:protein-arginine kinase activator protein McsA